MYKEGFIEVTGGRVWYQKFDENGNGTPLLVLHGGPGSSCFSLQVLKALSKDRRVILYDQLGCGRSDRPTDKSLWRIERFVEEVGQVREALHLDEVHILGHSWGTTLAAAYALTKTSGINSIIFSSPCLSAPLWEQDQKRNLQKLPVEVQKTIKENGTTDSEEFEAAIEVFAQHFVNRMEKKPEWLEQRPPEYRNDEIYNIMWGPSEFTVLGNLKNFDCTEQLKEITCPTLFSCGRYDEATPETTEYYSNLTPGSTFHVFEKSAHMPYIEESEEFLEVMDDFLKNIDRK
ncbi:proline iminopeptidase-family hydrolase [Neobacillus cucumis]|uniref:proline iminopeptidase-family hydrolase n=1 Tax=Neobacillus cucumis TaxID=1740721 RepID=UPI002E24354C|nr:proline iminopeptidase-family hydrolase [Neobacillus cucumis]MED4224667.1 proline iminopeptidase-family hydrolase [Neobacillus cucumis]